MLFVVIVVLLPFVCYLNSLGFTIGCNMGVYLFSCEIPIGFYCKLGNKWPAFLEVITYKNLIITFDNKEHINYEDLFLYDVK